MIKAYRIILERLALPHVRRLTGSRFWALYSSYRRDLRSLGAPAEETSLGRLNTLVEHAIETVPHYSTRYRGLFPKEGLANLDEVRRFPILAKSDLAGGFPDSVTSSKKQLLPWRYRSTSGTMDRLVVVHDYRKRDVARASQLLALNWSTGYRLGEKLLEIPPDICRNVCGAEAAIEPTIYRYLAEHGRNLRDPEVQSDLRGLIERQLLYRQRTLPSFSAGGLVQDPVALDWYLRQIGRYRPATLKALPAYLYVLALHILDNGLRPPVITRGITPMGGSLSRHMKRTIEDAFGCKVHEDYGSAELGAIAAECGSGDGLHPFSALFHVEVIRNGQRAAPGQVGRIVITDFFNHAMPFVRYEIGDVGIRRTGPCACGLSTDRIEVKGRLEDCVATRSGALITPDEISDVVLPQPGVLGFQMVVLGSGECDLRIAPRKGARPNLLKIQTDVGELLGAGFKVRARLVATIAPESSGKYRFVKREGATQQWRM